MYNKAKIYNLALSALLVTKRVSNENDPLPEAQALSTHWDTTYNKVLADLDLNSLRTYKELELVEENPNGLWTYAYKYPTNCALLRRLTNFTNLKDTRSNQLARSTGIHDGKKVIFTNEYQVWAEIIPNDLALTVLSAEAALALAYYLAWSAAAELVQGKGSVEIRKEIWQKYLTAKAEAQEKDHIENQTFDPEDVESEFVDARTS